jgi:DNA topoisomerase IA
VLDRVAVTKPPQGMTTAEIITEFGRQGIGQESIANALDVLVPAKNISSPGREGKYLPAASEVPTAPDQPSA